MNANPTGQLDTRFSAPDAAPTPWSVTWQVLERAELYWITTVRPDGRPHVTPLVGIGANDAVYFTTGLEEQKARNLQHNPHVAITTGNNSWASGLDVVVEGDAVRISDHESLQRLADAYGAKYGEFGAALFRIDPAKVLAFAKDPHGQTRYRY